MVSVIDNLHGNLQNGMHQGIDHRNSPMHALATWCVDFRFKWSEASTVYARIKIKDIDEFMAKFDSRHNDERERLSAGTNRFLACERETCIMSGLACPASFLFPDRAEEGQSERAPRFYFNARTFRAAGSPQTNAGAAEGQGKFQRWTTNCRQCRRHWGAIYEHVKQGPREPRRAVVNFEHGLLHPDDIWPEECQ